MENRPYARVENRDVVSMGDWIITFLISMIPLVNFIMLFVWAFSDSTPKSKANWAKAQLIIMLAMFAIGILLVILFWGTLVALMIGVATTGGLN